MEVYSGKHYIAINQLIITNMTKLDCIRIISYNVTRMSSQKLNKAFVVVLLLYVFGVDKEINASR